MNTLQVVHTEETMQSIENLSQEQYKSLYMAVKELVAAYPNANTASLTVGIYIADLSKLPLTDVKLAIRSLRTTSPYFPAVNEIYQEVTKLQESRSRQAAETEYRLQKQKRDSWKREGSTEVQQYLFAIQHNIDARKAKESPLIRAKHIAGLAGDTAKIEQIDQQLQEIRDDHQATAEMITAEFKDGKTISYLRELADKQNPSNATNDEVNNISFFPKSVPRTISNSNREECQACHGSGWQHVYERVQNSAFRMRSKGVMPCQCELGNKFLVSYQKQ